MIKEIECEEQVMILKAQYEELIKLSKNAPFKLTNHYFDTKNKDLIKSHKVLRIRLTNDINPTLELKVKGQKGNDEFHHAIQEISLDKELILPEDISEVAGVKAVNYLCSLTTYRIEIKYQDHLLVIDKNEYLDKVDYDIEVEAKSMEEAKKWILYYCEKYQLTYKKDYISKSRRVISLL